jgi:hypothetical protein
MNWYKKAKLIDVDYPREMNVMCAWCGRWATTSDTVNTPRENATWKKPNKLTYEEVLGVQRAQRKEQYNISHGLCPFCSGIARSFNAKRTPYTVELIKELSLKMSD